MTGRREFLLFVGCALLPQARPEREFDFSTSRRIAARLRC